MPFNTYCTIRHFLQHTLHNQTLSSTYIAQSDTFYNIHCTIRHFLQHTLHRHFLQHVLHNQTLSTTYIAQSDTFYNIHCTDTFFNMYCTIRHLLQHILDYQTTLSAKYVALLLLENTVYNVFCITREYVWPRSPVDPAKSAHIQTSPPETPGI